MNSCPIIHLTVKNNYLTSFNPSSPLRGGGAFVSFLEKFGDFLLFQMVDLLALFVWYVGLDSLCKALAWSRQYLMAIHTSIITLFSRNVGLDWVYDILLRPFTGCGSRSVNSIFYLLSRIFRHYCDIAQLVSVSRLKNII